MKRYLSLFLAVIMTISTFSGLAIQSGAETVTIGFTEKIADTSTLDGWKSFIGPNQQSTINAGAVWMDKSVFTDTSAFSNVKTSVRGYPVGMVDSNRNLLVALSAIASNKSIVGYSHIPTDTMLVLDVSASMTDNNARTMVNAANAAIKKLQDTNNHNRVGVVLYSGSTSTGNSSSDTATVLLPLGRYEQANDIYLVYGAKVIETQVWVEGHWEGRVPNRYWVEGHYETETETINAVSIGTGVTVYDETIPGYRAVADAYVEKIGGTFISNGIYTAMEELLKADTVIPQDAQFQAGTERMPIMVLMSDGAPTWARSSYFTKGQSNIGTGSDGSDAIYFTTQLAAAYAKARLDAHYKTTTPLFYTLGLGNSISTDTMNPEDSNNATIAGWWNSLVTNGSVTIGGNRSVTSTTVPNPNDAGAPTVFPSSVDQRIYADEYFAANNTNFAEVFDKIVQEIIIQSRYYPTDYKENDINFDGYITFIDDIGEYMDVKNVTGLVLNDKLYTGLSLAAELHEDNVDSGNDLDLGTIQNPTELGSMFVNAAAARLGISREQAIQLIDNAYNYGQISYTPATATENTKYSNYIGWYADENGNYLDFYDDDLAESSRPAAAKYTVKSYGYIDPVNLDPLSQSSMIFVSVQIRTEIATGNQQIIWKIPAALIPTISYDITIDSETIDTAKEVSVSYEGKEPIRLLFEVGLRDDITPYNITEKVSDKYRNQDGTYSFYTNQWNKDLLDDDTLSPSKAINTVAWFEPNVMNERYYFTEDTLVRNADGTAYTGTKPVSGEFYKEVNIFSWTGATNADGDYIATATSRLEHLSAETLESAVSGENGTWYIPKGTVHRHFHDTVFRKANNETKTLEQSHYPSIESATEGTIEHYYSDLVLGNNGKITYSPAQGIKVSKTVQAFEPGTDPSFTFTVTGTNTVAADGTYSAVRIDANGTATDTTVTFTNQTATLTLKKDETVYITNLPKGATYTVTENPTVNYELTAVKVNDTDIGTSAIASVTVKSKTIDEIEFINNLNTDGELIIRKFIEHPLANATLPATMEFTYDVNLGTVYANAVIETSNGNVTADANGVITVTVKPNGSTSIKLDNPQNDVPATVTERAVTGFTPVGGYTQRVVIPAGSYTVAEYTNRYEPSSVSPANVTVSGTKTLNGRDWMDTDSFTFVLERREFTATSYNYVEIANAVITSSNRTFDFTQAIQGETFNKEGVYVYRIREIVGTLGGVTYDVGEAYFEIEVTDTNWDGQYEIAAVKTHTSKATVTRNGENWNVTTGFTNTYAADDEDTVTVNITKNLIGDDSISKAGFKFGLYNMSATGSLGTLIKESALTDANGLTSVSLTFTAADIGKTYNYVVVEISEDPIKHVIYDTKEEKISVTVVDNWDGTIGAKVYPYNGDSTSATNNYTLTFTNRYEPTAELHIVKNFSDHSVFNKLNPPADLAFNITGPDNYNYTVYYTEFKQDASGNMVYTINLPAGSNAKEYVVTEINADVLNYVRTTTYSINGAAAVEGSAATVNVVTDDSYTVTFENSYDIATGSLEITKVVTPAEIILPDGLTFVIKDAEGNTVKSVTYAEFTNGSYLVTDLPIGDYTVEEVIQTAVIAGYTLTPSIVNNGEVTIVSGRTATVTVTNTYVQDVGTITVSKTFDVPAGVVLPSSVTVYIKSGDVIVDALTLTAAGNWTATSKALPVGNYTVTEDTANAGIAGYTLSVIGNNATATVTKDGNTAVDIKNVYTQDTGVITVEKIFSAPTGMTLPEAITVYVKSGDTVVETLRLTAANGWKATTGQLPVGSYTVVEDEELADVTNYTLTVTGNNATATVTKNGEASVAITNTYVRNVIEITLNKTIAGDLTALPEGQKITFTFTSVDDANEQYRIVLPTAAGAWTDTIQLPAGGYHVTESGAEVDGYAVIPAGLFTVYKSAGSLTLNVTNTYTREAGKLTIAKSFTGDLTPDLWPEVTFRFTDSQGTNFDFVLPYEGSWSREITLPTGTYTLTELNGAVDGYVFTAPAPQTVTVEKDTVLAPVVMVNDYDKIYVPDDVNVTVTKYWNDNGNVDRPAFVIAVLLQNGNIYDSVVLTKLNNWTYTWEGLSGLYNWSVDEYEVAPGYIKNVYKVGHNTYNIVNTMINAPTYESLTVNKVWLDFNNPERPSAVRVQLYRDGEAYGSTVLLSKNNNWTYTWDKLDDDYTWTVDEVNVPEGYNKTVSKNGNTVNIINTFIENEVDITVTKLWIDNGENRPESVSVQLYCNGQPHGQAIELSELNGWTYTWEDLDGDLLWVVDEVNVPEGYTKSLTVNGHNFVIVNTEDEVPETPTLDDAPVKTAYSLAGLLFAITAVSAMVIVKNRKKAK